MRNILFVIALLAASPTVAADFDYAAYETAQLDEVSNQVKAESTEGYLLLATHLKYHTVATFTGRMRPISPDAKKLIGFFMTSLQHPDEYKQMFELEAEIEQEQNHYWMPIQQVLVEPLGQEVPAGESVHLYLLLLGGYNGIPVFAISEFDANGG